MRDYIFWGVSATVLLILATNAAYPVISAIDTVGGLIAYSVFFLLSFKKDL